MSKWTIQGNSLIFQIDESNSYNPTAEEIYSLKFAEVEDLAAYKPIDNIEFPETLSFSKMPLEPKYFFTVEEGSITFRAYVVDSDHKTEVFFPNCGGSNHVVIDGRWYYFESTFDLINNALSDCGITDASHISYKDYIQFSSALHDIPFCAVEDNVAETIKNQHAENSAQIPTDINANLYPYQQDGYKWLKFITEQNCGCVLGDEMGLGKTLQVITLLASRKYVANNSSLVLAPVSLLENWKREINKFAPSLSLLVHQGPNRTGNYKDFLNYDVVIMSYGTVGSDLSILKMVNWDCLVLDEAQKIKNPYAKVTGFVKQIPHRTSIAVTGTPFENHMTDLWSLLDFTMPGCLGNLSTFNLMYEDDIRSAEKIEPLLSALMLRRRVSEVAKDLPEKVEIPQVLTMSDREALRYEDTRNAIRKAYDNNSVTLAQLTKLRMFCTHPFLLEESISERDPAQYSIKYMRFCEIMEEIVSRGEKVILFTSFVKMFQIISADIPQRFSIPVDSIYGEVPPMERQQIIDNFSEYKGPALLVLNPRTAGAGLNIAAANHVIHYNLEWNPAVEDQATARAYRRGQTKTVFVYRLYYQNTMEEVVNEKISLKRDLSDVAVVGNTGSIDERELLIKALQMTPLMMGSESAYDN